VLPDSYFAKALTEARSHLADVQNLITILERLAGTAAANGSRGPTRRGRRPAAAAPAPARRGARRRRGPDKAPRKARGPRAIIRGEVPLATMITNALNATPGGLAVDALTARLHADGWRTASATPVQLVRVALAKLMADKIAIVDKTGDAAVYRLRAHVVRRRKPEAAAPAA